MPSNRRISWAQLRVGIMAAAAIALLFLLIFLLTGNKNIFSNEATLYTFMGDSAAMTEGSAVRLNGIMIGQVKKIALSGSRDPNKTVRFDLQVREDILKNIPVDSLVTLGAENVLGTKFINIKQGKSPQHVENGATLAAREDR